MKKSVVALFLFVHVTFFAHGNASADIYACNDRGKKIFSDNPANLPAGCRNRVVRSNGPSASRGEEKTVEMSQSSFGETLIQAEKEAEERAKRIEEMKKQARALVDEYNKAVTKRFRSTFVSDELEAAREITAVKNRRDAMEKEIDRLPTRARDEIQAILSGIPK